MKAHIVLTCGCLLLSACASTKFVHKTTFSRSQVVLVDPNTGQVLGAAIELKESQTVEKSRPATDAEIKILEKAAQ